MRALLVPLLPLALLAACHNRADADVTGAGATRDYPLTGFDKVALKGADNVDVAIGPAFAVRATGDAKVLDRLEIVVENGTLKVGRKRQWGGWDASGTARVRVTLPALNEVQLAGSGDMRVGAVRGAAFAGSVAGSGDLTLAGVAARRVDLSIAGSGGIVAAGRAGSGSYAVAGSGNIDARRLTADTLDLRAAGSGDVAAAARGRARVSLIGSGDVTVTGGARCEVTKLGSGEVRCG